MTISTLFPTPLPSLELFANLSLAELDLALPSARVRQVAKDTRIFNQGDAAGWAYVVIQGSIRVSAAPAVINMSYQLDATIHNTQWITAISI
jgi:hypothetical protein